MTTQHYSQQVFRGSVDECWKHYLATHQLSSTSTTKARKCFYEEFRVPRGTADKWFSGYCPQGFYRVRMEHFLDERHYAVTELEKFDRESDLFRLRQLICSGDIHFEEIRALLGYKAGSSLLKVLYGDIIPVPKKRAIISKLVRRGAQARESERRPLASLDQNLASPVRQLSRTSSREHSKVGNTTTQVICAVLPAMLQAAIPLLQFLVSDEGTELRVALLQENTKLLFDFTNVIGALGSDIARERYINSTSSRK